MVLILDRQKPRVWIYRECCGSGAGADGWRLLLGED